MALPKLLREIFENDGAGPKFRADKIPVAQVTVDSALSDTSENPVQNKVIKSALDACATKDSIPVITSGTTDLTAGTSALATGAIYLLYE